MADCPVPYFVVYNARLRKHVVVNTASEAIVAEFDTAEAARDECERLIECWLVSREVALRTDAPRHPSRRLPRTRPPAARLSARVLGGSSDGSSGDEDSVQEATR